MAPAPNPRRPPLARRRLTALLVAGLLAVVTSTATTTWAVFSAVTSNGDSSLLAGTVGLAQDDTSALFVDLPPMAPGQSHQRCIELSNTGNLDSAVRMYGTLGGTGLQHLMDLVVEQADGSSVTPGPGHDCTVGGAFTPDVTRFSGRLASFPSTWADGVRLGTWAPRSSAVLRITLALPPGATSGQGTTATVSFTWEAQAGT